MYIGVLIRELFHGLSVVTMTAADTSDSAFVDKNKAFLEDHFTTKFRHNIDEFCSKFSEFKEAIWTVTIIDTSLPASKQRQIIFEIPAVQESDR